MCMLTNIYLNLHETNMNYDNKFTLQRALNFYKFKKHLFLPNQFKQICRIFHHTKKKTYKTFPDQH